jgi:hypothetical protein
VQLLIDRSRAMQPFYRDQRQLAMRAGVIVGADRLQVLSFSSLPTYAGTGPRSDWLPYAHPPGGTVILLLTDLGIGRPPSNDGVASIEEWITWAGARRKDDCPVVCLVPYPQSRWPKGFDRLTASRLMTILVWDRSTSVGTVRRYVKRGHRVAR